MKRITPYLWFDTEAEEAADFYISLFDNSKITGIYVLEDTPSGIATTVNFELAGQPFSAISAGPYFKLNLSLSIMVQCSTKDEADKLWNALLDGGNELMALGEHSFGKSYGWLEDRYGLSWQILLVDHPISQKLIPQFLFSNAVNGKAEEALRYYTEVFPESSIEDLHHYKSGDIENPRAKVLFSEFYLAGTQFNAIDDAFESDFTFNEAFSLEILCDDQKEIDYYWEKLSAVPEADLCGWVKDKFGVSWQIVPASMDELFTTGSREQINRVTKALLKMKKINIEELEKNKTRNRITKGIISFMR
ncbi:VOC family protein [Alkalibacterium sp. 20]|uniref:VOC family protein n=1 Tax=Alkalibacterium sp. 20 TaxID=1798803 RepID=UPI0008FFF64C|nr:VOC family protein [Alkalibacterium sp. 20]OJF92416.1 hypothetical protein AX762_10220 [Alkalibacterium sp. 20]